MRATFGTGAVVEGRAVDCREREVSPGALAAAIRRSDAAGLAGSNRENNCDSDGAVSVYCEDPRPVHEHVGLVGPSTSVDVRPALAAAARSRDVSVAAASSLAAARADLAAVEVPDVDLAAARERVAAAREAAEAVQADVAAARGAVQAREDVDADVAVGRERLRAAVATASERETELVAAEQALERERERARRARDARSRRLELEDRVGRLERTVRESLVRSMWATFADAVATVPGGDPSVVGAEPGSFAGGDATAALAIARVASMRAPVVVSVDRFASAEHAADVLDAPVLLASP
ncbi:hypothetical protein G9C85_09105 [Halorubellus sp. JP-L1]|uniref:DUF7856 family protein n=1 Tax=Halorubellus sp. JP-L1 TaxID=2715753 RepID=UPI00140A8588|nr:hypothetical protein [Halorubellus sp. JP-L1]NHN41787.1 hypothetical protein [Halorubellus sp. JP-L1]